MPRIRTRTAGLIVAFTALSLVAAACGGDDDDDAADTTEPPATETTTADEPDGDVVEVTAIDYAYEGLPESLAAGTSIALHNDAPAELHEFVAFLLPEDETRSVEEIAALPEEELGAMFAGEPAMVLIAPPGEDGMAVVGDGTVTEPGRYAVFCAIPQGADPDEYMAAAQEAGEGPPQVEGGPPHFTLGMVAEFTVE